MLPSGSTTRASVLFDSKTLPPRSTNSLTVRRRSCVGQLIWTGAEGVALSNSIHGPEWS